MDKLSLSLPLGGFSAQWPGLEIQEHAGTELVSLACAYGHEKTFAAAFKKTYGSPLPAPNEMAKIKGGDVVWTGQHQYMLLLNGENINADKDVAAVFGDIAYTTLQTDGWASVDITGERIHDVLERFISLDLRRKPTGFSARTSAHHMSVIVMKLAGESYRILTPRSSSSAFLDALRHTIG